MQKFKCKIGLSAGMFIIQLVFLIFLSLVLFAVFTDFSIAKISLTAYFLIGGVAFVLSYLYAGFTNTDIIVYDSKIEMINRLPFFKKNRSFLFEEIKEIRFRHEWQETSGKKIKPVILRYLIIDFFPSFFIPADYKWIKIYTKEEYKFYCFGIEYDCYENNDLAFEDLFKLLNKKGVNVNWTNSADLYYLSIKEDQKSGKV